MKVYNVPNFISAQPLNVSFNSSAYQLNQAMGFSIQLVITGTPTGVFKLQCSDDANSGAQSPLAQNPLSNPVNWTDVANSSFTVTAAGNIVWNVTSAMYNWIRVAYTDGSAGASTAIVNGTLNHKGI